MSDISETKTEFTDYASWRSTQQFYENQIKEGVQELYREILEYKLRELRQLKALTQLQLAKQLGVTQNRISKFERLDLEKAELQTIRSYVEAVGGKLQLVVTLDGVAHPLA